MKKHLIIGDPISHSLSPKLHNYWFSQNNIDAIYEKFQAKEYEIEKFLNQIKSNQIWGMNVTVPFKKKVIPFIEKLSETAKETSSVNTVFKKDNLIYGDNTDVQGFELSLKYENCELKDKKAFILGAGGVVPSIIKALKNLGIKKIFLSNRTINNSDYIVKLFPEITIIEWGQIPDFDIIINATSLGLKNNDYINLDFKKINDSKIFYDLIYNPSVTNFLDKAKKSGHKIINGKMMLLFQAQRAFKIWHGFLPKIDDNLIKFLDND
ncbi:MAG: shikimate dehydrogenase [Proteobacteria bacterium]|nr:shikimate dehydrogenase [Pseudomonadota bacterium]